MAVTIYETIRFSRDAKAFGSVGNAAAPAYAASDSGEKPYSAPFRDA